ncbi:MAG: magnesium transporter [Planctomycetes bacterium RIFCSPHIGHO2_02_FULL_50_42]|nr:MAG: magnesium transporter [Planctomycetes bacterium RIFCSPHIGHO2_02_FULL_50_42]
MQWYKIFVPEITELIEQRNLKELGEFLRGLHPADIVDILRDLPSADRVVAFRVLDKAKLAWVFSLLEPEEQEELLKLFTEQKVKEILLEMDSDDRAQFLEELPADVIKRFLTLLPHDEKEITNLILNYPENSAGRLISTDYVDLRPDTTAAEAIEQVRQTGLDKETIYICYVVDKTRKLIGVLSLRDVILAPPSKKIEDIMKTMVLSVKTTDDREVAARIIQRYDLLAVPVVDQEDRLVGIVTVDDVIDIFEEEATEDMEKMAAVSRPEESYFRTDFISSVRKRAIWLFILMVIQTLTGSIMQIYEETLSSFMILTYFIPMVISVGGNVSAQSSTMVIRGLATGDLKPPVLWTILRRECSMGPILGIMLGLIAVGRALLWAHSIMIGLAVAAGIVTIAFLGNLCGALLPLLFRRLKIDPAVASAPLMATLMDVTGVLIYLVVTINILKWVEIL